MTNPKNVYAPDGRRLIFRVQNAEGEGPYNAAVWGENGRGVLLSRLLLKTFLNSTVHPNPYNDAGLRDFWEYNRSPEYLFGFRNLSQLTNWFMWPRRMYWCRNMAHIGVYAVDAEEDVHNVVDGQFQSIFHQEAAELIAELPLNTTHYNPETGEHNAD